MSSATSTRTRLLQAAVALIHDDGVQAVTHRAVEDRAGVARGSTRYYFGTREALLAAVIDHVAAVDNAVIAEAAARVGGSTGPGEMDAATQDSALRAMTELFLADPRQSLVRFELYLYAARRPELAEAMAGWRQAFVAFGAAHLRAQGATDPEAGSRVMAAAVDGLMLHALSSPHADYLTWGPRWVARIGAEAARLAEPDG